MKRLTALLAVVAALSLPACAPWTYRVQVNGYTDPGIPGQITPGGTFFVIENQDAKNPLLEKEIKGKIVKLLGGRGYPSAPYEKAQYYLFFHYGMGPPRSTTVVMPDYWGPEFYGGYPWGASYAIVGPGFGFGFGAYAPYAETLYDRWLLLNVVDGQYYREKGQFRTLWVGEAKSTGTSSDLRQVVNYLLVAAFDKFGQNTRKAQRMDIEEQDFRVKQLER